MFSISRFSFQNYSCIYLCYVYLRLLPSVFSLFKPLSVCTTECCFCNLITCGIQLKEVEFEWTTSPPSFDTDTSEIKHCPLASKKSGELALKAISRKIRLHSVLGRFLRVRLMNWCCQETVHINFSITNFHLEVWRNILSFSWQVKFMHLYLKS